MTLEDKINKEIYDVLFSEEEFFSRKYFEGKKFTHKHVYKYILANTTGKVASFSLILDSEPDHMRPLVLRTLLKPYIKMYGERYPHKLTDSDIVVIDKKMAEKLIYTSIDTIYEGTREDVIYLLDRGGIVDAMKALTHIVMTDKVLPKLIAENQTKPKKDGFAKHIEYVAKLIENYSVAEKGQLLIDNKYAPESVDEKKIIKNIRQYYRHANDKLTYVCGSGIEVITLADGSKIDSTTIGFKGENGELNYDIPYCEIYCNAILTWVQGYPKLFTITTIDTSDYLTFASYFYSEANKAKQSKSAIKEFDKMIKAIYNAKNQTVSKWLFI